MKNLSYMILVLTLCGCASPEIITGNSRSVTIVDGIPQSYAAVKELADKHCAKYNRVSGVEKSHSSVRRKEFECVDK